MASRHAAVLSSPAKRMSSTTRWPLARPPRVAARVLHDIDAVANLDIAEAFDAQQRLKSIHDMPLHLRRCITSIEVVKRNLAAGDRT